MKKAKLKPCPFCGGKLTFIKITQDIIWHNVINAELGRCCAVMKKQPKGGGTGEQTMSKEKQIDIFGNAVDVKPKTDKKKRKWENGFQRWSNNEGMNNPTSSTGKCGYGSMCYSCEDNTYGRPCVRALNEMCREKGITIDYEKKTYEEVWDGDF